MNPAIGEQQAACPARDCRCTHTAPCDRGWIDNDDASVRPCATCRPAQARIVSESATAPLGPGRLSLLRDRAVTKNYGRRRT